jgi:hypothetical protein
LPYPSPSLYPALIVYPGPAALPARGRPRDVWRAFQLQYADGRCKRFGPDERFDADIPSAIQFDTQTPGGFGSGSLVLPRPPRLRADDAALFSHGVIYGPDGTDYEGRVVGIPQVGVEEIRLELEGWSAALDDDETFKAIFRDADLSRWQGPSQQRQVNLGDGFALGSPSVVWGGAAPALQTSFTGTWDHTLVHPRTEAWYDANGIPIGKLIAGWGKNALVGTDATWHWFAGLSSDDVATASQFSADQHGVGPASVEVDANGIYRFAILYLDYSGTSDGGDGQEYIVNWFPTVHGAHGLADAGGGYLGSDILAYALAGTGLDYSLGDSIERSSFAIPHLVFLEPVTRRQLVEQVTALGGAQLVPNDWGVYDNREFFHRSPGSYGKTWRVRRDQVATPTSEGPDSKDRIGGIMISYRDGAGRTHSVGPPGSGAEYESSDLLDTDPQNPANRLSRRWRHRQVGITNQEGALNIGRMLLAEANRVDWRGSTVVRGEATDSAGHKSPASHMRAGDRIVIEDDEEPSEHPIVKTSYVHDDLAASVDIGAPPDSAEVLLAQLEAATDLLAA